MNIEIFEEQLNTDSNFNKIRERLRDFVIDVDNIDYDSYETELNEVLAAHLDSMDIKEVSELEVNGSSFECVIEVEGNIEIEDHAFGEEISDSVEITFNVTATGVIENDEIVIKDIEKVEIF